MFNVPNMSVLNPSARLLRQLRLNFSIGKTGFRSVSSVSILHPSRPALTSPAPRAVFENTVYPINRVALRVNAPTALGQTHTNHTRVRLGNAM